MITESFSQRFLRDSQLRSLRNLSWFTEKLRRKILKRLSISTNEYVYLVHWTSLCNNKLPLGMFNKLFPLYIKPFNTIDNYELCYDNNYNLTPTGQEMKNAALVAHYE